MYYQAEGTAQHTRLKQAIVVALLLHAAIVLGVSFQPPEGSQGARQIEITLATRPSHATPDDARRLAQADQLV